MCLVHSGVKRAALLNTQTEPRSCGLGVEQQRAGGTPISARTCRKAGMDALAVVYARD